MGQQGKNNIENPREKKFKGFVRTANSIILWVVIMQAVIGLSILEQTIGKVSAVNLGRTFPSKGKI